VASKSELKRQKKALEAKKRERAVKKAAAAHRKAVREARAGVSPSVPMWRRAGFWLSSLQNVPPAVANDEILLTLCKVSLLLRGMYQAKPSMEVGIALQVVDTLGTGLSGSKVPEAWASVPAEKGDSEPEKRPDDQSPQGAEGVDGGQAALDRPESGIVLPDVVGVPAHPVDGAADDVQPVLDAANALEDV
jgi:hypothetical protein